MAVTRQGRATKFMSKMKAIILGTKTAQLNPEQARTNLQVFYDQNKGKSCEPRQDQNKPRQRCTFVIKMKGSITMHDSCAQELRSEQAKDHD